MPRPGVFVKAVGLDIEWNRIQASQYRKGMLMFENWFRRGRRLAAIAVVSVPLTASVLAGAADGDDEVRARASFCKEVADCTAYFT
jgi:hypothetical protein